MLFFVPTTTQPHCVVLLSILPQAEIAEKVDVNAMQDQGAPTRMLAYNAENFPEQWTVHRDAQGTPCRISSACVDATALKSTMLPQVTRTKLESLFPHMKQGSA
jgi:hypothetical protein